jgi:hypothetical protein
MQESLEGALERDLKPLLEESARMLGFDSEQRELIEEFMTDAWCSGVRSGREQMDARLGPKGPNAEEVALANFAEDFKPLMMEAADAFNLTVLETVGMWGFLQEAWQAGNRSCEAELMAFWIEFRKADVDEEARSWLDGREAGEG